MDEKGTVRPRGFWATLATALGCLYTVTKMAFVLVAVFALFGLIALGYRANGDYGTPEGWQRVHDKTQFETARSLDRPAGAENVNGLRAVVIRFDGDTQANGRDTIARQVDEIIVNKEHVSEVVLVVESPGGAVSEYGQVFAELQRLRDQNIPLTVCIDVVAASGGYLMSLPANKILAAPLATVGSVGVVMEMPNVYELLKALGVQWVTVTSGKYKRTLTPTTEITPEASEKVKQEVEESAAIFLALVKKYRPNANIEIISTADHWSAQQSVDKKLGLVDGISTSSQYLLELRRSHDILNLSESKPMSNPLGGLLGTIEHLEDHLVDHLLQKLSLQRPMPR